MDVPLISPRMMRVSLPAVWYNLFMVSFMRLIILYEPDISLYARELASLQRGMPEYFFEPFFRELQPFSRIEFNDFRNGIEPEFMMGFRETIPGANFLAGIATKHPAIKLPGKCIGYHRFL